MILYMALTFGSLLIRDSSQGEHDFLRKCSVRYNMLKFLNETTCEQVYKYNPVCKKILAVSYSKFPPYIYTNDTGQVDGILPGMKHIQNFL